MSLLLEFVKKNHGEKEEKEIRSISIEFLKDNGYINKKHEIEDGYECEIKEELNFNKNSSLFCDLLTVKCNSELEGYLDNKENNDVNEIIENILNPALESYMKIDDELILLDELVPLRKDRQKNIYPHYNNIRDSLIKINSSLIKTNKYKKKVSHFRNIIKKEIENRIIPTWNGNENKNKILDNLLKTYLPLTEDELGSQKDLLNKKLKEVKKN
ncbi:MAG: hypothetical protein AAF443_03370 [Chlamydiota bacterium]